MPVLAQRSFLSWPYPISQRSSRRPKQGARSPRMETPDFCHRILEFLGISGLLPSIYPRYLQDCEAHDKAPSEGSQVYLDIRLRSSLPAVENFTDHCASLDPTRYHQIIRCIL